MNERLRYFESQTGETWEAHTGDAEPTESEWQRWLATDVSSEEM